MTPRVRPRARPRKTSVDFSRLWWLVRMEAAFRVTQADNSCHHVSLTRMGLGSFRDHYWAVYRRCARLILARKKVVV